jgi:chromosomal replication initiation ATPase DnaA
MNTFLDVFNNGRPVLYNMVSLLGTAGSGKSFVMQIIKNKLS